MPLCGVFVKFLIRIKGSDEKWDSGPKAIVFFAWNLGWEVAQLISSARTADFWRSLIGRTESRVRLASPNRLPTLGVVDLLSAHGLLLLFDLWRATTLRRRSSSLGKARHGSKGPGSVGGPFLFKIFNTKLRIMGNQIHLFLSSFPFRWLNVSLPLPPNFIQRGGRSGGLLTLNNLYYYFPPPPRDFYRSWVLLWSGLCQMCGAESSSCSSPCSSHASLYLLWK